MMLVFYVVICHHGRETETSIYVYGGGAYVVG